MNSDPGQSAYETNVRMLASHRARWWYQVNREHELLKRKVRYDQDLEFGTCVCCDNPSLEGRTMCAKHAAMTREKARRAYQKRQKGKMMILSKDEIQVFDRCLEAAINGLSVTTDIDDQTGPKQVGQIGVLVSKALEIAAQTIQARRSAFKQLRRPRAATPEVSDTEAHKSSEEV